MNSPVLRGAVQRALQADIELGSSASVGRPASESSCARTVRPVLVISSCKKRARGSARSK
jgi:hypothetical protein